MITWEKSGVSNSRSLLAVLALMLCGLCVPQVRAQNGANGRGVIDAGTTIPVRINEAINSRYSNGRVYSGVVARNVINRRGGVAIPRGSAVELVVRYISNNEMTLDLDSVTVNGQRYGVETQDIAVTNGTNQVGGDLLSAVIGAIAGGGVARGERVSVPAGSVATFRLERPLRVGARDFGISQDGQHYHSGYGPYSEYGQQRGDRDDQREYGEQRRDQDGQREYGQQRRYGQPDYGPRGYDQRGYDQRDNGRVGGGSIRIEANHNVTWQAPKLARVYVQVDNKAPQVFAEGASGTQGAPWIQTGHLYVFILRDSNGAELGRDQIDLRQSAGGSRPGNR